MQIYIHIPFCVQKCKYCDFLSMPADDETKHRYVEALLSEIQLYSFLLSDYEPVETVYLGGGTPSVLDVDDLILILDAIFAGFSLQNGAEITMEANPATISRENLQKLLKHGLTRLSLGLQSTNNEELRKLGRIHSFEQFVETYDAAREVGYKNINVDLMSALPGQSLDQYLQNLKITIGMKPEHISSYSLIIEPGTPYFEAYSDHPELLPDEDTDREMYHMTKKLLKEAGYERYEISNYALTNYESRHNSGYWIGRPYLGLGLGASSCLFHTRFRNCTDLAEYLQKFEALNLRLQNLKKCKKNEFLQVEQSEEYRKDCDGRAYLAFDLEGTTQNNVLKHDLTSKEAKILRKLISLHKLAKNEKILDFQGKNDAHSCKNQTTYVDLSENIFDQDKQDKSDAKTEGRDHQHHLIEILDQLVAFDETEYLSAEDEMSEFMFLGLRMSKGISISEFTKRFGKDIFDVFGTQIAKFEQEKLLTVDRENDRIALTDYGMDVSNYVFEGFV